MQKLVGSVAQDALSFMTEEGLHTDAFADDCRGVDAALEELAQEFSPNLIDPELLQSALTQAISRGRTKTERFEQDVSVLLVLTKNKYSSVCLALGDISTGSRAKTGHPCRYNRKFSNGQILIFSIVAIRPNSGQIPHVLAAEGFYTSAFRGEILC